MPKKFLLIEILAIVLVLAVNWLISRPAGPAITQAMPAAKTNAGMQGNANNTVTLERPPFLNEQ